MIGYLVEKNQIVKTFPTQVMGYPTIKFFSPGTPAGNMGEERASRDKSVPAIKVLFKVPEQTAICGFSRKTWWDS